jgi:hypothetical protein
MAKVLKITIERPLRGRDHYWGVMRQLAAARGNFIIPDVAAECCGEADEDIRDYLKRLERAGIAERTGERRLGCKAGGGRDNLCDVWRLKRAHGPAPRLRRDGSECPMEGQARLWTAIRSLREFTVAELAYAASMDAPMRHTTAGTYVQRLLAAGYLVQHDKSYRLKLSMNTGPEAPKILRTHSVWDPNRRALVGNTTTEEVSS